MPDPTTSAQFTVNGSPVTGEIAVAAGSTVDLALVSTFGISTIEWSFIGSHDPDVVNPTITVAGYPSGTTASFVMPATAGDQGFVLQCKVNGGRDITGALNSSYTATALIGVAVTSSGVAFSFNEAFERGLYGYVPKLNLIASGAVSAFTGRLLLLESRDAVPSDAGKLIVNEGASNFVYTVDDDTFDQGQIVRFEARGTGTITVSVAGGASINIRKTAGDSLTVGTQYRRAELFAHGASGATPQEFTFTQIGSALPSFSENSALIRIGSGAISAPTIEENTVLGRAAGGNVLAQSLDGFYYENAGCRARGGFLYATTFDDLADSATATMTAVGVDGDGNYTFTIFVEATGVDDSEYEAAYLLKLKRVAGVMTGAHLASPIETAGVTPSAEIAVTFANNSGGLRVSVENNSSQLINGTIAATWFFVPKRAAPVP